ncbi:MAG TPA: histidinol dehydrogenase [Thermodesulfobacteriota bacterium]|nr:histidinol dehydrogenase [Deltaproteobacteria bacterium]HNR12716.1 histidinol dehydrogenase [Thermodesulfobacteriota bacterium]HNU72694.1 histidinol dehydrogenase [Thermodesulfobacteriota bacterium]HOC39192.1 histidinol dehydrogenase [Thermodesulfobacteriota bacterium]HQO76872.1 histidinol dehydrogenase [Thermodesulfobacteriota bacterium]
MKILNMWEKDSLEALETLLSRSHETKTSVEEAVREVVDQVRSRGDEAVAEYTSRFDGVQLAARDFQVPETDLEKALNSLSAPVRESLFLARDRIEAFHCEGKIRSWMSTSTPGEVLGQVVVPLDRVGIYVPGGKAAYPSSVLMNALPARVAGVTEIIMVTPPSRQGLNPLTLAAAQACGIKRVFQIGGAQAVAALAYGTGTVPAVDKIVGPGNLFVATAKKLVSGEVGIDMIAGPSEILVIADESANPECIAYDLLSQAEHDEQAKAILVTSSVSVAQAVNQELERQLRFLPRQDILTASLDDYGCIIITRDLLHAVQISNRFAPEHLLLAVQEPFTLLGSIRHAGSVFLGHFSPVAAGDYLAGPNHVLPTSGTARFSSPLGVYDFVKCFSITHFDRPHLQSLAEHIVRLARLEGLEAHARSVEVRLTSKP